MATSTISATLSIGNSTPSIRPIPASTHDSSRQQRSTPRSVTGPFDSPELFAHSTELNWVRRYADFDISNRTNERKGRTVSRSRRLDACVLEILRQRSRVLRKCDLRLFDLGMPLLFPLEAVVALVA